jgi:putative tryptophan/tyrosine transport system substrate-binding protein
MRRRAFIAALGGAAAWPVATRAQQTERVRRIGILINFAADDPAARSRLEAFLDGLHSLGWIDGRNVQIDLRWGAGDVDRVRVCAAELVSLRPDVIFANGVTSVGALQIRLVAELSQIWLGREGPPPGSLTMSTRSP